MKIISALFFSIYNNKRLLLIFIFLLSLFASTVFLLLFKNIGPLQHRIPGTDYLTFYKPVADNILSGRGIVKEGKLATATPPGYSIILSAILGLSYLLDIAELKLVVIFNLIITAAASLMIFLICQFLFNKKIGLIASFIWLSYPLNLWLVKNPNTEVPFILFLYLGVFLFILSLKKTSWKYIFLAGIFFGFASLVRPISFLISLVLALFIIFFPRELPKRGKIFLALVLLIGNILAVLPWEIYVLFQTGELIPLSTLGPGAATIGLTFALRPGGAGHKVVVPDDVKALMERAEAEDFKSGAAIFRFCLKELFSRPIPFLKLLALKASRAWYATSQKWYEGLMLLIQIPYLLTAFLGLIFLVLQKKLRNTILLLVIILYFWLMTISAHSILRYMLPVMGLVAIFSAVTLNKLIEKLNLKKYGFFGFNNNSLPE